MNALNWCDEAPCAAQFLPQELYLRPPRGRYALLTCHAKRTPMEQWFLAEPFRLRAKTAPSSTSLIQDMTVARKLLRALDLFDYWAMKKVFLRIAFKKSITYTCAISFQNGSAKTTSKVQSVLKEGRMGKCQMPSSYWITEITPCSRQTLVQVQLP